MVQLYNTMTRKVEMFQPIIPGHAGIYTCGPTVYSFAHIGNLRAYVFADTLTRVLRANGFEVAHVMNITDVGHLSGDSDTGEDKMEKGAAREGKTVWEVAQFYTDAFLQDIDRLNIARPSVLCRATEHIPQMIAMIQALERNGLTYVAGGNVYFDTSRSPNYGRLARLRLNDAAVLSRVEADPNKRSPFDFVLWFTSYKYASHAMLWDSPWGRGFPGWHIECSAMASHYLGSQFDIHTGGVDHIPVHHTNEIAQSEGALGVNPWVNTWMHNEFLAIDGKKMAKSEGNLLTLQYLVDERYDPLDYRYFLLGSHYRAKVKFSPEALLDARTALRRLRQRVANLENNGTADASLVADEYQPFLEVVNDDLNTAKALAIVWQVAKSDLPAEVKLALMGKFDQILGLNLVSTIPVETIPVEVELLAKERQAARLARNFDRADELRLKIEIAGYRVTDTAEGYTIDKR